MSQFHHGPTPPNCRLMAESTHVSSVLTIPETASLVLLLSVCNSLPKSSLLTTAYGQFGSAEELSYINGRWKLADTSGCLHKWYQFSDPFWIHAPCPTTSWFFSLKTWHLFPHHLNLGFVCFHRLQVVSTFATEKDFVHFYFLPILLGSPWVCGQANLSGRHMEQPRSLWKSW